MKNLTPWTDKVFDRPRAGFVAEHGSQLHPLTKPPEPVKPPPPQAPSPLDKIIDEDRRGFVVEQRATTELTRCSLANGTDKGT